MIDVRNLGDLIISLGAVAGGLIAIAVVMRFVVVRPLMNMIDKRVVTQMHRTERKLDRLTARFEDHVRIHPGPGPAKRPRRTA